MTPSLLSFNSIFVKVLLKYIQFQNKLNITCKVIRHDTLQSKFAVNIQFSVAFYSTEDYYMSIPL